VDQPLEITVRADNQADAEAQGQNIINSQIRGGPSPGIPVNGNIHIRGGSPRLYSLSSVKIISRI
jgi:hypothetical protein